MSALPHHITITVYMAVTKCLTEGTAKEKGLKVQLGMAMRNILALAAGVRGSWSHCIHNLGAEGDGCWCPVCLS